MINQTKTLFFSFILALISGLVFDYLFFDKAPGVSFVVFVLLLASVFFIQRSYFKTPLPKSIYLLIALLVFFSLMISIRASDQLTAFNILASGILILLIVREATGLRLKDFHIGDYVKTLVILPFSILAQAIVSLPRVARRNPEEQKRTITPIVRGIIISLPILILFFALFYSADLVFQKYLTDIFNLNLPENFLAHIFVILIISFIVFGASAYIFDSNSKPIGVSQPQKRFNIGLIEVYILLGSISFLFLIFILVQIQYLFGGESNITELGFTYAEYARRGFFELIAVAILSLLIIFGLDKYTHGENGRSSVFKILAAILIFEVILIEFSAHKRLTLYETAYGLTILRFYSHAFAILIQIAFLELMYKVLFKKTERSFLFALFATGALFLIVLNLASPDKFIARHNIARYYEGGKLDVWYLGNLSVDTFGEVSKLLKNPDRQVQIDGANTLEHMSNRIKRRTEYQDWQSFHFSFNEAQKIYNANQNQIQTQSQQSPSWSPPLP